MIPWIIAATIRRLGQKFRAGRQNPVEPNDATGTLAMSTFVSAFERVSLPQHATDDDVRDAYSFLVARHGGDPTAIPAELAEAFNLLLNHRSAYADLLQCCEVVRPIAVSPSDFPKLKALADSQGIHCAPDADVANVCHVWRADQPEPAVVTRQRARQEAATARSRSILPHVRYWFSRLLLAVAMCGLGVAAYYGWRYFQATASERAARAEQAARSKLRLELHGQLVDASAERTALYAAGAALAEAFQSATSQPIEQINGASSRPRELNLAIIRHDSLRQAWDEVARARLTADERDQFDGEFTRLRSSIDSESVSEADAALLRDLRARLGRRLKQVHWAQESARHIRETLDADRFEKTLENSGKESP